MAAEPCQDPRLALGAGLSATASALVSLALGGYTAAAVQLVAAGILFGSAAYALRYRQPVVSAVPEVPRLEAVDQALAALGADRVG